MLALLYLLLCFITGFSICRIVYPKLELVSENTYRGQKTGISCVFLTLPVWFATGTLFVTWSAYIFANAFNKTASPLFAGNMAAVLLCCLFSAAVIFLLYKNNELKLKYYIQEFKRISIPEIVFLSIFLLLCCRIMYVTFNISHNHLYVGSNISESITPHISMMRSFSTGSNFPTSFTLFGNSDTKFGFMFDFLAGNLEYLGFNIDNAYNIPSVFGMFFMLCILYVLTVKLTGRKIVGLICTVLLTFRSSFSLILFLADIGPDDSIIHALKTNSDFLGFTAGESDGIFNLNAFCSQRSLSFVMIIMIFLIIIYLPGVYEGTLHKNLFKESITKESGWFCKEYGVNIASGILLGSFAFWNSSVVCATILIIIAFAVFSDRRFEHLIVLGAATVMCIVQSGVFISENHNTLKFSFGFLSESKNFFGMIVYLTRLLGILPLLIIIIFAISKGTRRYLMVAFSLPLIYAFTFTIKPNVAENSVFVVISVLLFNIFVANFIVMLWNNKKSAMRVLCVLISLMLISTGIYEYGILIKKSSGSDYFVADLQDELTKWLIDNVSGNEIIATADIKFCSDRGSQAYFLSGRQLYNASEYLNNLSGYNISYRDSVINLLYSAYSPQMLRKIVEDNGIDYIIVDYNNRTSKNYDLNEENISATYPIVFSTGDKEFKINIYKTDN